MNESLRLMGAMTFFALWQNSDGNRYWAGPFPSSTEARDSVPAFAWASVIVIPIADPILRTALDTREETP